MHGAAAGGSNVQPHAVIAQRQATRLIQHFKSRIMRRQSLHQTEPTIVFMLRVIQLGLKHQHAVINLADYINKPAVLADDHNARAAQAGYRIAIDRKSTRLNSSHVAISYAVFCLKKQKYRKELLKLQ